MAKVRFVEKNGSRVDITGLDQLEEFRCDLCGEYVSSSDRVTLQAAYTDPDHRAHTATGDAHLACLADAIHHLAAQLEPRGEPAF